MDVFDNIGSLYFQGISKKNPKSKRIIRVNLFPVSSFSIRSMYNPSQCQNWRQYIFQNIPRGYSSTKELKKENEIDYSLPENKRHEATFISTGFAICAT